MAYVAITGFHLTKLWQAPRFYWHAARAMKQAKSARGNLLAEARFIRGIHHTLTVWQTREAMLAYMREGPHLQAMKAFGTMGGGSTYGYETDAIPDWTKAHGLWTEFGRTIYAK